MKVARFAVPAALVFVLTPSLLPSRPPGVPPDVIPNDNRVPAGQLSYDTLTLSLVLDLATWRPEGESGPAVVVPAFREEGGAPRIPAPLIRVKAGTIIRAALRNGLDSAMIIHGLFTRPDSSAPEFALGPGEAMTVTFAAGEAGTYMYGALPAGYVPPATAVRTAEREQAFGALVVDPPGGAPPDRVLVINIWGDTTDSGTYRNALTLNGLSWPHTERMDGVTGDSVRWRVINASARAHPMHLHGFYFRVDARGGLARDRTFPHAERRLVVTESMAPRTTMAMSWLPDRPGNWLFHCHLSFHAVPAARLDGALPDAAAHGVHLPGEHMAGLVLGVRVRPSPAFVEPDRAGSQRLRLLVQEGKRRHHAARSLGYVLQRGAVHPAPDSVEIPGSLIVLERGQPTDIVVANRLKESVAVHWHGLELESWSDGVAGWSGSEGRVAPAIAPGDSFIARLTQPRAGTFIYHTHINDIDQLTSGLYGALVVLEPGQPFRPETDHVILFSWDGFEEGGSPRVLVNGDSIPRPLQLASGATHRLRFVNISPALLYGISLLRDSTMVSWRRVALDGAELPAHQAIVAPAIHHLAVGQTADFEVELEPGRYTLAYAHPAIGTIKQDVIVKGSGEK